VYVANSGDGTISTYSLNNTTGVLSPIGSPLLVGSGLSTLASFPGGSSFVYATSSQGVWVFGPDVSGLPIPIPGSPFAAGSGPGPLAMLQAGIGSRLNGVYVVNTVDGTVSAYTQDSTTGALIPLAGPAVKTGKAPSSILVIPRPGTG
jgi:hypothetical protein